MKTNDLIAYFRLSKEKKRKDGHAQPEWGWSLESQQAAVAALAGARGAEILATYQEIETGKRADRPELGKAIAHARRAGTTLVIAKLDHRHPRFPHT